MRIERVEIARLRGIPAGWPALDIGDKGLVVYGPNGVGKSSIIDALESTLTGRSTLFAAPRAGVNWETAAPHLRGGPPSVTIRGKLGGKNLELVLGREPVSDLAVWAKAARAASFVLRRYMLLRFIEAQPRERYQQIEPFLNLESFSAFENGLKELAQELDIVLSVANNEVAAQSQIIRQTFGLERDTQVERRALTDLLRTRLKDSGVSIGETEVLDLGTVAKLLNHELGGEASTARLGFLGAAKQLAQQLTSATLILPLYLQARSAANDLAKELHSSLQKVPVHLLEHALEHINATTADTCPICEQSVDRKSLIGRLGERIEEDKAVQLAASTLQKRLEVLRNACATARQSYANFIVGWDQTAIQSLPSCYEAALQLFTRLEALTANTITQNHDEIDAEFSAAECQPSSEVARIDEAITLVGGGGRRTLLLQAQNCVTSLQENVVKFEEAWKSAFVIAERKRAIDRLHAHAEAARKASVQHVVNQVAKQANEFYEEIHPKENIATSTLTVRQATSASMQLSASFYGHETPPMRYYSESHLDTLGLCYFLAIRKMEIATSPIFKLLLVDDVLHSVDAEHRTRLAHLLKNHFGDQQLVIVTHDKYFYDRLRVILGAGYKYVSITDWDIECGPRLSDPSTDFDRVIDPSARAGKSHEETAAAGGRFFEWLLKQLTEKLQVAIQARFSREHDIGSMWPALAKKLSRRKSFEAKNPGLVKELTDNAWVRNKIGAHDNESESAVTPNEVTAFVDKVADLYRAVTCDECENMIQPSQSDVWRCECSKLQYDP